MTNEEDPQLTQELVQQAREGDRDAFDELFSRVTDRLLVFIEMRLGRAMRGKVECLDVLQDAYLEAYRSFADYRGDSAFSHWVCRIIENRIRGLADHFGAQKRRPAKDFVPIDEVLDRAWLSRTGPLTAAARVEERETLIRAMRTLEEAEREAVLLRYYEGLGIQEIAERLGRSSSTVKRLLGRATVRLGSYLKGR